MPDRCEAFPRIHQRKSIRRIRAFPGCFTPGPGSDPDQLTMSSASEQQNALTGGDEPIQCSASSDAYDDETKRQVETFLDVLASVSLAVAARQSDQG